MRLRDSIQIVILLAAGVAAAGSVLAFWFYYGLYWQHRHRFNDVGRYMDERDVVVYQEQNGMLIVPALGLAIVAAALFLTWWWRRRSFEAR